MTEKSGIDGGYLYQLLAKQLAEGDYDELIVDPGKRMLAVRVGDNWQLYQKLGEESWVQSIRVDELEELKEAGVRL